MNSPYTLKQVTSANPQKSCENNSPCELWGKCENQEITKVTAWISPNEHLLP